MSLSRWKSGCIALGSLEFFSVAYLACIGHMFLLVMNNGNEKS